VRRNLAAILLQAALCVSLHARQEDLPGQIRTAQAQGRYDEASKLYRTLIDSGTDGPEIRSNYGIMLHLAARNREAVEQFQIALRARPDLIAANLFNGLSEIDLGQPKEALPYLKRANDLDARSPAPALALGRAYAALRDFEQANIAYTDATKRDPNSSEAWFGVGITDRSLAERRIARSAHGESPNTNETQRLLDAAFVALRRAAEIDPQSARVHLILGESLRDSNKLVDAIPEYEAAIRLQPRMEAAYLGLATTYWKQAQWDDVMQPLQRALDLSPQDPEAHAIFADMLFRGGDTAGAEKHAEIALAGNSRLAVTRVVLARIYLARNQPQKAAAELERVSDVDPDGSYHFLLWRAYKLAGKPADAQIALDEYHRRRDALNGRAPR
jgi:tetratricopeptide (TPR) repeat protein